MICRSPGVPMTPPATWPADCQPRSFVTALLLHARHACHRLLPAGRQYQDPPHGVAWGRVGCAAAQQETHLHFWLKPGSSPPAVAFGLLSHACFLPSLALAVLCFPPSPPSPPSHRLSLHSSKPPWANHCCGRVHRQRPQRCCCIWQLYGHPATLTSSQERSQAQAWFHTQPAASYACQWCDGVGRAT